MAEARFTFPRNFLWGTATAAHQVEGGNTNNNWALWEEAGRVEAGHSARVACDWWNGRWQEDLDRAAKAGQNAHRLSIEWSRVQPAENRWDEEAIAYYLEIVRGIRERGMEPMVTLHHFTDPIWVYERGGWENDISAWFAGYVRKVVEALRGEVSLWCTVNEPNVYATTGYVLGVFPPGKTNLLAGFKVMENLVRGHAAAYEVIKKLQPDARVGMAVNYRGMEPYRKWLPLDAWVARTQSKLYNDFFPDALMTGVLRFPHKRVSLPQAKGTQDFLGINYYTQDYVSFAPFQPAMAFGKRFYRPDAPLSETGFIAHEPKGFYTAIHWGQRYQLPIFITENGVENRNDDFRRMYLAEHIHQLWRAINFNFPVQGYFHWSLVDNFEWERGWTQRFGLWELDVETQERIKRPSADFYAEICRENALSSEMVARYAPDVFPEMFPNE